MCRTNAESKSQSQDVGSTSNAISKEEMSHHPPPPRRRFLIGTGILGRKAAIIAIAGVFTAMIAVRLSLDCVLCRRIAEEAVLAIPVEESNRTRRRSPGALFAKLRPWRRKHGDRVDSGEDGGEGAGGKESARAARSWRRRRRNGESHSRETSSSPQAAGASTTVEKSREESELSVDGASRTRSKERPRLLKWLFPWRRRRSGRGNRSVAEFGGPANADERSRLLKQLRQQVAEHPGDLERRAKAVGHELDDATLSRFLHMGCWTLEAGGKPLAEAIDNTLKWREKVKPHLITGKEIMDEAACGKLYTRGHDRQGRAVIFYTPGSGMTLDVEMGLKLLFYTMERAAASLPEHQEQFAVVADCSGFGPSKVPPLTMIKDAFLVMQRHYPMRLGYVMIVHASSPITFVWKLISTVLHPRTHEKIVFLTPKEAAAKLSVHIDPATMPSTLPGGRDPYRYQNDGYFVA